MRSTQAMETVAAAMTRRGVLGAGLAGAAMAATASVPGIARVECDPRRMTRQRASATLLETVRTFIPRRERRPG